LTSTDPVVREATAVMVTERFSSSFPAGLLKTWVAFEGVPSGR
jgi:hypothetical protein